MRRNYLLLAIFISLAFAPNCLAISQYSATLTKIEKSLFGTDYSTQSDEQRLSRIEENVYGSPSTQPIQTRVSKLSTDLAADQIGQEIKPKADTFTDENGNPNDDLPKSDKSVNYPIVDNLENSVFNKEFKSDDIHQRLANLELKVFKKTYSDDLNSRVERLKSSIMPERVAQNQDSSDDDSSDNENYNYNPKKYNSKVKDLYSPFNQNSMNPTNNYPDMDDDGSNNNLALGQPSGYGAAVPNANDPDIDYSEDSPNYSSPNFDMTAQISKLEKKILHKTYSSDVIANRLLRLELKEFNSAFTDDDSQTRVARIASAYQAKKSASKYDSNKFAQHMATAVQVGAILLMILAAIL